MRARDGDLLTDGLRRGEDRNCLKRNGGDGRMPFLLGLWVGGRTTWTWT